MPFTLKKSPPLVSICIPSYQSEHWIAKTLDSACKQTYPFLEILISDDASQDASRKIIKHYQEKDSRIQAQFQPVRLGAAKNWNTILNRAQGTYLKLLCADDLLSLTCIEKQVAIFEEDFEKTIQLVSSQRHLILANNQILCTPQGLGKHSGRWKVEEVKKALIRSGTNLLGEPSVGLFRRQLLEDESLQYRTELAYLIDLDFWLQILEHGELFFLAEPLASFRISNSAWSTKLAKSQLKETQLFFKTLEKTVNTLEKTSQKTYSRYDISRGRLLMRARTHARSLLYGLLELKVFLYRFFRKKI